MHSRQQTIPPAWPSLRHVRGQLLGLPFLLTALGPTLSLGWKAWFVALMIANVATFVVYVPLTVLVLNGGAPLVADEPAPSLTPCSYLVLLALWTVTAWAGATFASHL
jgi:hypothetical protein